MRSRALLAAAVLAGSLALPAAAYAAIPFFGPIIPAAHNVCPAGWGMLITVINNIIELALTLAIVFVAPLVIAYAGFLMVLNPTAIGDVSRARSILLNLVIGIVVALAGWLIVDAIMAALYNPAAAGGTWYSLISSGGANPCLPVSSSLNQTPSGGQVTGVSATGVSAVTPPSAAPPSEALIRQQFAAAGVSVNRPACSPYDLNGVTNGCTNVGGMLPATVSQVIALKKACGSGCSVTVTGGSEAGHAAGTYSHGTGYKADLRSAGEGTTLTDWIKKNLTSGAARSGDCAGASPTYADSCGNQYVNEQGNGKCAAHWDITVYRSCPL